MICDFCGVPDHGPTPTTLYPCRDFDTGTPAITVPIPGATNASKGAWCACDRCAGYIDRTEREALVQYCVQRHIDHDHDLRRQSFRARPILLAALRELQGDFWRHREGPGRPMRSDELHDGLPEPEISFHDGPNRRAAWLDLL